MINIIKGMNLMKFVKGFFVIKLFSAVSMFAAVSISQAAPPPSFNTPLDDLVIYSGAAITIGASSNLGGHIQIMEAATVGASTIVAGSMAVGKAITIGADSAISGSITAGDAGTIGADTIIEGDLTTGGASTSGAKTDVSNISVGGNITAGAAVTIGAGAEIVGNVRSGSAAAITLGASSIVRGNTQAGAALTIGASSLVEGNVQAGTGALGLGAKTLVKGSATAGGAITVGDGGAVEGAKTPNSPEVLTNEPKPVIDDQSIQLTRVQDDLASITHATSLAPAMASNTTLVKGVYRASALTTSADVILTFDGKGVEGHWLINIDNVLTFGARTKMILKDVVPGSTITWNVLGSIDVGATTDLVGFFFSDTSITTGASVVLKNISMRCSVLFSNSGAITLGASNQIATSDCNTQKFHRIHHYQIVHDGQGLTCEPEIVTISACTNYDYNFCAESGRVMTLDVKATGSSSIDDTIIFTGTGTASIPYAIAESTTLSLENLSIGARNPTVCFSSSGDSCDIEFADAGFIFSNGIAGSLGTIPSQVAGNTFPLNLQVVKNNEGVCEGLFVNEKDIGFSQENVEQGVVGGLRFSMGGNNIAKHSSASTTNIRLNFGPESIAEIPTPIYHDAGPIRLHAYYDLEGIAVYGNSNIFWVSPNKLVVAATLEGRSLNGTSATAATTHKAGEDFALAVTALNSLNVPTQNYKAGQIQLKLGRTGPRSAGSVDGNFTYAATTAMATNIEPGFQSVPFTSFTSGVAKFEFAKYSEVGLINLEVRDSDYGDSNIVISSTAINIGRFIPDHFTQAVAEEGDFFTTCYTGTAFAYSGQKNESTNTVGTISYLTNPILEITAFNKQGGVTQNYYEDSQGSINDYMKLSAADVTVTTPTLDQVAIGVDTNTLSLTANMNSGILSQYNLTASDSGDDLPRGVLHYKLADGDNFFYNRSANALVAPFTADINFSIASIIDTDTVNVTETVDASPAGVEIRFGRLRLENSFGPETLDFPQPMSIEHFDGEDFIVSSNNNCVSYDAGKISLTNISLDPALTEAKGGIGFFVAGKTQAIELQAPGTDKQGHIGVLYNTYDWLEYDWDNDGAHDNDPHATATFGVYRGNDRMVYWREIIK
jgi:serine acetyltransferase